MARLRNSLNTQRRTLSLFLHVRFDNLHGSMNVIDFLFFPSGSFNFEFFSSISLICIFNLLILNLELEM
jgi:hypothetical protein